MYDRATNPHLQDIYICLNYHSGTHYPASPNYLGELLDALLEHGESKTKIINTMRFFYGVEVANNKWNAVARTEDDQTIWKTISMQGNPKVKLLGQEGLFHLGFWGNEKTTGAFSRAKDFEELLEFTGLRKAMPVPFSDSSFPTTRGSGIPSRIAIPQF